LERRLRHFRLGWGGSDGIDKAVKLSSHAKFACGSEMVITDGGATVAILAMTVTSSHAGARILRPPKGDHGQGRDAQQSRDDERPHGVRFVALINFAGRTKRIDRR
jgi:hypothetical protein